VLGCLPLYRAVYNHVSAIASIKKLSAFYWISGVVGALVFLTSFSGSGRRQPIAQAASLSQRPTFTMATLYLFYPSWPCSRLALFTAALIHDRAARSGQIALSMMMQAAKRAGR
jgi:hypothetical protein